MLKRIVAVVASALLVGCSGLPAPGGAGGGASSGPIRVGLVIPTTGGVAASGADMVNGWNLYWKQKGARIGNRAVETIHEDTGGDPNTAITKGRQLVEQRQVHMILGPLLANEGYALADYTKTTSVPLFTPVVASDDLTQRQKSDTVVRVAGWASSQSHHPFGEWAAEQGYKNILTICSDYAFGHEVCGGFARTFTGKGGKIAAQLWTPLNAPDYSSYMTQIQGTQGIDAVFALAVGADGPRFMRQWAEFGLKGKIPMLAGAVLMDQSLLRGMGPEAEGIISAHHFVEGREAAPTREFVDLYLKEHNQLPSYFAASMYVAAGWIAQAVEKNGGNVEDSKKLIEAVKSISLTDSAFGPMSLDEYNNPIHNVYVRKVEKRPDGKQWNVPVKTYEKVSQFWTFGATEFLKQPVYSRAFQGLPEQIKK
jgi:branched-chain amino acid transport system substrate-binding protein